MLASFTGREVSVPEDADLRYRACEIVQLAGQLLESSSALLARALATCRTGTAVGFQITEAIASLKLKLGENTSLKSLNFAVLDDLTRTTAKARIAARQAASATLDIRKTIGGPDSPPNRYPWLLPLNLLTLVEAEEGLLRLSKHSTLLRQNWAAHKEEMTSIELGIQAMLEVACRNTVIAAEAAQAAERLHIQAINFVRVVERSGLLLSPDLE